MAADTEDLPPLRFNSVPGIYEHASCLTLEELTTMPDGERPLFAFATTLLYEVPFVLRAFPPPTAVALVCPRRNRHRRGELPAEHAARVRVAHNGGGTLHSKLWLLQGRDALRVAVHSANLKPLDWEGMTENFFVLDVPLSAAARAARDSRGLPPPPVDEVVQRGVVWLESAPGAESASPFARALRMHVDAIGECDSDFLLQYDFAGAGAAAGGGVELVASVPGAFPRTAGLSTGHEALRQALARALPPPPAGGGADAVDEILVQVSNVGGLSAAWFDAELLPALRTGAAPDARVRVVFPSAATMAASPHGAEHGWYFYWKDESGNGARFVVDSHDARFPGLLLHSKVYVGLSGGRVRWLYAGSHNLSQAAWGRFDAASERFVVKNFELGVLLVLPPGAPAPHLPFPLEPRGYGEGEGPWCGLD